MFPNIFKVLYAKTDNINVISIRAHCAIYVYAKVQKVHSYCAYAYAVQSKSNSAIICAALYFINLNIS